MNRALPFVLLALAGCSILVPFEPGLPEDGGLADIVDGDVDGEIDGGIDAGHDAGIDSGIDGGPPPELCNNGADDDGDGLSDCHDSDCARESGCCAGGSRSSLVFEDWRAQGWRAAPSTVGIFPQTEGGSIVGFEPADVPLAVVSEECIPMALGHDISVDWQLSPDFRPSERGCDEGARCTDYAAMVLTPTTDMLPGRRLFHELSVVFYPSGVVAITQNDAERFSTDRFQPGQHLRLELSLRPKLDAGRPYLDAEVSIALSSDPRVRETWKGFLVALDDLVQDGSACSAVPGLHLAFEGRGEGVRILRGADRESLACVNPNLFGNAAVTAEAPLVSGPGTPDRSSLGFEPSAGETPACAGPSWTPWAIEGLGSPTLYGESEGEGATRWHLMAEASNEQPELEVAHRVGYALGYASQREANWNIDWVETSACPARGAQPPSCRGEGCPSTPSLREPFLGSEVLAYAEELEAGNERFGISVELGPALPPGARASTMIAPPDGFSYRDPVLLPDLGRSHRYLLFVSTAAVTGTAQSHIDVLALSDVGSECTGSPPCVIAGPTRILDGSVGGSAGVWGPEVLVDADEDALLVRLWYLAAASDGRTSVNLALGRRASGEELPQGFVLFAGNPVLTASTPSLRCDAPGLSGCTIEGLAVARDPNPAIPHALRFLVARNVRLEGGNRRRELVPLQQAWRPTPEPLP